MITHMAKIREIEPTMAGRIEMEDALAKTPGSPPKCITTQQPDGGVQVAFLIEPTAAHRLRRKAGTMPLERFLWENILQRAIDTAAF